MEILKKIEDALPLRNKMTANTSCDAAWCMLRLRPFTCRQLYSPSSDHTLASCSPFFVSLLAFSLVFIIIKPQWFINSIYSSPTFKLVNISGNFIDIVCVCVCVRERERERELCEGYIYEYVISKGQLCIQILCAQKSETQYAWFARMMRICDMQLWFFISRAELPFALRGIIASPKS